MLGSAFHLIAADWLVESWSGLWHVPLSALVLLSVVIASVRLVGLRSFSKMSSFDFAVTVSIGSILGSVATSSASLVNGALAVVSLLLVQAAISWGRSRRIGIQSAVDNTPLLLMDGPNLQHANMRAARVTRSDITAKLREANVLRLQDVQAVVLETTGDISVLHGPHEIDPMLLEGLQGFGIEGEG